jgi:hypothetical protein
VPTSGPLFEVELDFCAQTMRGMDVGLSFFLFSQDL